MRIGMILDAEYPIDPRVLNESLSLIDSGNSVYLFCLSFKKNFIENEIIDGININRFYCSWFTYKMSALAYTLPFYKWIMSRKIKKFIKINKIKFLHIHDIQIASSVFLANSFFKLNTVLDLHENRPEIMKFYKHVNSFIGKLLIFPSLWKKAEEKYVKMANGVVVVTELAKSELKERVKIDSKKIIVFPNSVTKNFYLNCNIRNDILSRYAGSFVMLYIGNTSKRRGLDLVLKSVKKITEYIPNFKFVIVGSSSHDYNLKKTIKKLKISNFIDFEGWQNQDLFPSYIKSADIAISPLESNIHHNTTYANKIFQYISFGCPIIGSDVTAQKDLIEKYKLGLIFSSTSSDDFIKKTLKLYKDEGLRKEIGENCLNAISNNLNNEIISKDLIDFYAKK